MKIRIMAATLLSCILSVAQVSNNTQAPNRSQAEQTVAILLAENGQAPIHGFLQTLISQLGDDASIGVIQYLGERKTTVSADSTSPQEIRRILEIIRMAFVVASANRSNGNGVPKATFVLLQYLNTLPAAGAVRNELDSTTKFVERVKLEALQQSDSRPRQR